MKYFNFTIFLTLLVICNCKKVEVAVYYESLCPDSQKFITEQIVPEMKNGLNKDVDIKWIPFGKSTFTTLGADTNFICHHGPNECYANKIHSCAIKHIQGNSFKKETKEYLLLDYIGCLMKPTNNFSDNLYPGKFCADKIELRNWSVIEECANSTEGSKLLQENGKITNDLENPLKSVPSVTINNKFEREIQQEALVNFRSAVCKEMYPKSEICASLNSAPTITVVVPVLGITLTAMTLFQQII